MNYITATVFLWVIGLAPISNAHPPEGAQVLKILFQHLDVELTKESEPLCTMSSFNGEVVTLGAHLARVLSSGFEQQHTTTLKAGCFAAKQEIKSQLVPSWDCQLNISEIDKADEVVASSTIKYALDRTHLKWLPGTMWCL